MLKNKKILLIMALLFVTVMGFSRAPAITYGCSTASPACGVGGGTTPTPAATPAPTKTTSTGDYCDDGSTPDSSTGLCADGSTPIADPPIATTTDCAAGKTSTCAGPSCTGNNCDITSTYIIPFIDFLSAGVGLIVTIMIVIGGIQYTTSQDDPQKVSAAKNRIRNAFLALIMFGLMYSFLQWLVPGGIFNG